MAWPTNPRPAKSLLVLRDQVDARWPNRLKGNDGMLGDARHAAGTSDHNPNAAGVVTAIDITKDLAHGLNSRTVAQALLDSRDPRIKYIISDGQICSSKVSPWVWRPYSGADDHSHHFHLSVDADPALYDDTRPWQFLPAGSQITTMPRPGLFSNITATEFGGAGDEQPTAYTDVAAGWPLRPGVALPFRFGQPRPRVHVFRDGKSIDCEIVDVGPWNIRDPYWQTGTRPQAETGTDLTGRKTNGAGIDLTPAAARAIGLNGKGTVDWEFIGAVPVIVPAPLPKPSRPATPPPRPIPTPPTPTTEPTMNNPFALLKFLPLIFRLIQFVPQIQAALKSGSIFTLLPTLAPQLMAIFQELGADLFPTLPPDAQAKAGSLIADPAKVLFVQNAINTLGLASPPLVADGHYGQITKAAVEAFQTAHGMTVDGWAGDVTAAALQAELDKRPKT